MRKPRAVERPDNREVEYENLRPPAREGEPPITDCP